MQHLYICMHAHAHFHLSTLAHATSRYRLSFFLTLPLSLSVYIPPINVFYLIERLNIHNHSCDKNR